MDSVSSIKLLLAGSGRLSALLCDLGTVNKYRSVGFS